MKILLNRLHELKEKYGYLPREELEKVANEFGIPLSRVYSFATFYTAFSTKTEKICICKGTACLLKGSERIEEMLRNSNIKYNVIRCFGACSMSPVIGIEEKIYGKITPNKLKEILNR